MIGSISMVGTHNRPNLAPMQATCNPMIFPMLIILPTFALTRTFYRKCVCRAQCFLIGFFGDQFQNP